MNKEKIKKISLILVGSICVALGVIGMFLPLLPTTPFLLLASVCYTKSSKKFSDWLLTNRLCGQYIKNYKEGKGMILRQKILTLTLLWLSISYSCFFAISRLFVKFILFTIAILVTIHILTIKNLRN
ncbi:MAG: YbaN family protein [Candidatus Brocadiae bacterium]|nr:YbaN family protein [Candidatus Brocadiia bacterium]